MIYTYSENPISVEVFNDTDGLYFKITATINKHEKKLKDIE